MASRKFNEVELEAGRAENLDFELTDLADNPLPLNLNDVLYFLLSPVKGGAPSLAINSAAPTAGGSVIEITTRGDFTTAPKLPAKGKVRLSKTDTQAFNGLMYVSMDLDDSGEAVEALAIKPVTRGQIRFNPNSALP